MAVKQTENPPDSAPHRSPAPRRPHRASPNPRTPGLAVSTPGLAVKRPPGRPPGRQTPSTSPTSLEENGSPPGPGPDPTPTGTRWFAADEQHHPGHPADDPNRHPADGPRPDPTPDPPAADSLDFDRGALSDLIRGVLVWLSLLVHSGLARSEVEKVSSVWIADEDDQAAMGDPLTSLAARHGGPGVGNRDTADALAAGFGLLAYCLKHGFRAFEMRRNARRLLLILPDLDEADPTPPAA